MRVNGPDHGTILGNILVSVQRPKSRAASKHIDDCLPCLAIRIGPYLLLQVWRQRVDQWNAETYVVAEAHPREGPRVVQQLGLRVEIVRGQVREERESAREVGISLRQAERRIHHVGHRIARVGNNVCHWAHAVTRGPSKADSSGSAAGTGTLPGQKLGGGRLAVVQKSSFGPESTVG